MHAFLCFFAFFSVFMLARNEWVFRVYRRVLRERGHEVYCRLPSYGSMLLRVWVWDVNKFIKEEGQ